MRYYAVKEKRLAKPFVTISYELGARAKSVIQGLGEYLQTHERRKGAQWRIYDGNLLKKVAEDHQLPQTVLPYLSESITSELENIIEETIGLHPSRHLLVNEINDTIFQLAQSGYAILVGRGSNIVTADLLQGAHVRLVAPVADRIRYLREILNMEEEQARRYIVQEERNRREYFHKYFHKNIDDSRLYDLTINTAKLPVQDVIRMIVDLVFHVKNENLYHRPLHASA
ncbi:MAG: cytidylate kinase-like family protein [Candidatus Omnitrophica bacterium]|nr:cytidylate kinase-like family protein [Candidatus Omnitrophota bacterium]